MNDEELLALANESADIDGAAPFVKSGDSERYSTTEVYATYKGHSVRIEFTDTSSSPAAYRYNATVYDAETGDQIATGNGGRTWEDAFSIVHWRELSVRWP